MNKKQETLDQKQDNSDNQPEASEKKQETLAKKQEISDKIQETQGMKQETLDRLHDTLDKKQQNLDKKAETLDEKEENLVKEQETLDKKQETLKEKQEISAKIQEISDEKQEASYILRCSPPKNKVSHTSLHEVHDQSNIVDLCTINDDAVPEVVPATVIVKGRPLCYSRPPSARGAVPVYLENYMTLKCGEQSDDALVDFVAQDTLNSLSPDLRDDVFVFPTSFYQRLVTPPKDDSDAMTRENLLPEEARQHSRVAQMFPHLDIKKYRYILFPISDSVHFFLFTLVRNPGKTPVLILLDSLNWRETKAIKNLLNYMKLEADVKACRVLRPTAPKQLDSVSCGFFTAEFLKFVLLNLPQFLEMAENNNLQDILDPTSIDAKRSSLAALIRLESVAQGRVVSGAQWPDLGLPLPQALPLQVGQPVAGLGWFYIILFNPIPRNNQN